ncbi:uncharacterized protein LOC125953785 isoform X1 [Anopheles darlingi]|uniref:uncharacterized protein LOC125953785 isoform X1 n=1 Tax=Anopheles darlingi TaxID=43151 RepID=UPI0021005509|nr:uncharacterized protein LOC125953785 isoform X1 [Anopheles darlingi]
MDVSDETGVEIVFAQLSYQQLFNYRFELKLWLIVQDTNAPFLSWNCDETAIILDPVGLSKYLQTPYNKLFFCRSVADFCWLLEIVGFSECSDGGETEGCKSYHHHLFRGDNMLTFEKWLIEGTHRNGVDPDVKGSCSLPLIPGYHVKDNGYFDEEKAKIATELFQLNLLIQQKKIKREIDGSLSFGKASRYKDEPVMEPPEYLKTETIAGNYGLVSVDALRRCLGAMMPLFENRCYEDAPERTIQFCASVFENGGNGAEVTLQVPMVTDSHGPIEIENVMLPLDIPSQEQELAETEIVDTEESAAAAANYLNFSVKKEGSLCLDQFSPFVLTASVATKMKPID